MKVPLYTLIDIGIEILMILFLYFFADRTASNIAVFLVGQMTLILQTLFYVLTRGDDGE
jgi:hypothetical protein